MSVKVKALLALATVCILWGVTWVATKEGVLHMPALQFAATRQLFGGTLYMIFFLSKGYRLPKGKEWYTVITLSLLNFILSNGLVTLGLKYINAGLGAIITALFPLWIVVIGLFAKGSTPPRKAILGLIIGFAGICIIFYDQLENFLNAEFRLGIMLSLIASFTWALGSLYTKKSASSFNPYFSIGLQMIIAGIVMGGTAIGTGNTIPLAEVVWQSWAAIVFLGIFGSALAFAAYIYALQHLPMAQASIYAYMNPVVAVLAGFMVYNDPLTIYLGIGGAVILYGVWLVNSVYNRPAAENRVSE